MLIIKTHIKNSPIHGIGLFASKFIPKDTLVWELNTKFDLIFNESEFDLLHQNAKDSIVFYGHFQKEEGGYILCSDDARFFNHSTEPNCKSQIGKTYAIKDINVGEEITDNYMEWDELFKLKNIK
jgi:SET domain-containing protein